MPLKALTNKELIGYFQVYREAFPDWDVKHDVVLTRSLGPISQHIAFQSLSYGAYRPECRIWVAGPPDRGSCLLDLMIDVKHRQVERRQHDTKWPKVLRAMEEQFVPNVRQPLDITEVLSLAENEIAGADRVNLRICNGLATLNVHLGRNEQAAQWCDRAELNLKEFGHDPPPPDWMLKQAEFASQLRDAIQTDQGLAFLADAADQ